MPLTSLWESFSSSPDTLTWAAISLYDFFFSFKKVTLRRKQINAAFLNIGNALFYICNSTITANSKQCLLSTFLYFRNHASFFTDSMSCNL